MYVTREKRVLHEVSRTKNVRLNTHNCVNEISYTDFRTIREQDAQLMKCDWMTDPTR